MKILYVSQWLSAIGGGGEIVFRDLAYGMNRFNHTVEVISQRHADIIDSPSKHTVNIHRIRPMLYGSPPPSLKQNIAFILGGLILGARIIANRKIDVIHANNMSSAFIGAVLSKLFSLPLIITIHSVYGKNNFWKEWGYQPKVSRLTALIAPMAERFTIKVKSDAIHTVTHSSKNDILEIGTKSKIYVVHNGISLDDYDKICLPIEYQDYVLFIGRLVVNKNLGLLINAFKEVTKSLPHAKLVILGDGPMRNEWEKLTTSLELQSNIEFIGFVAEKMKAELLSKCSALMLPSYMEAFTLTVLEAFTMHKTVIIPKINAAYEVVDDAVDGFIAALDNPSDWAEKILLLLTDKVMARKMGERARAKVEEKFNQKRVLEEINSIYYQVIMDRKQSFSHKARVWRTLSSRLT
jgi:glycosyltransferase involved in cell wall biosynthesis